MPNIQRIAIFLAVVSAPFLAAPVEAQSNERKPVWETLLQAPLPEDAEPKISVFSIPVGPAPLVPRPPGAGHTHAGPVFAYILQGDIENQVEPDPPRIYKPGGFFYEIPGHVHKFLRNLSQTESAMLIIFQAGNTGNPVPAIKLLLQQPLLTTANQELSLLRVTIPAGTSAQDQPHSGPCIVYVLEGKIETIDRLRTYSAGDLFMEPQNPAGSSFANASATEPARLLLYQVSPPAK